MTASALALGALLADSLPFSDPVERLAFRGAIGLGGLAVAVQALGLVGGIRPAAICALLAAPIAIALWRRPQIDPASTAPSFGRGPWLLLAFALAPALLLALYPPTAFDATLYHLPFAKAFATRHRTVFLPALRFPVFPQLVEMLYAAALSISDDVTAQLIHLLCLALTTVALVAWARRFSSDRAGVWAAAAWLGSPVVIATGAAAYVDAGLALFCTASLYAWMIARETRDARWLDWSAVFAGLAASTKYHGLVFVLAIPGALLLLRPRAGGRAALRFLGIAVLVLSPSYGRIVADTGNPLFPYFSAWFGPNAWAEPLDPASPQRGLVGLQWLTRGHAARAVEETFLPGSASPRRSILSPVLIVLPPLVVAAALFGRRWRALCAVLLFYALLWYMLTPSARFLFPILPAASLVAATFADGSLRRRGIPHRVPERTLSAAIALALVLPGVAYAWHRLWRQGPLPVSREARESYLDAQVLPHASLRGLNETLGDRYTVYCLHCESAAYYADGQFRGDHFGPYAFTRVEAAMGAAPSLQAVLREMGVTHLLVKHTRRETPLPGNPALEELFTPIPAPPGVSLYALR